MCESDEIAFWAEGGDILTGTTRLTVGEDGKLEFFGLLEGVARSNSVGICVMIQDTRLAPVVQVQAGVTTEVEWKLIGH